MKRFLVSALAVAAMAVGSSRAEAALLVINDGPSIWTLDVQTGCTTCAVKLTANFVDPAGPTDNNRLGTFLDSIQWTLTSPNISPSSDANIGFTTTTAGASANWAFQLAPLNANQCNDASSNDSICGEYVVTGGSTAAQAQAGGYGPITNGLILEWNFNTTFASALPNTLIGGNIRAAFNDANGNNVGIFSPGGGTFQGQGQPLQGQGQPQQGSPEPASVLLFGAALTAVGMRLRRARA